MNFFLKILQTKQKINAVNMGGQVVTITTSCVFFKNSMIPNIDSSKELIIRFIEDLPSFKRLILLIFNEEFLLNSDNSFLENFILYLLGMPVITST